MIQARTPRARRGPARRAASHRAPPGHPGVPKAAAGPIRRASPSTADISGSKREGRMGWRELGSFEGLGNFNIMTLISQAVATRHERLVYTERATKYRLQFVHPVPRRSLMLYDGRVYCRFGQIRAISMSAVAQAPLKTSSGHGWGVVTHVLSLPVLVLCLRVRDSPAVRYST